MLLAAEVPRSLLVSNEMEASQIRMCGSGIVPTLNHLH